MKTKILNVFCVLLAIAAITVVVNHFGLPLAKVTVKVVDENQQPIGNAIISLNFDNKIVRGTTDSKGLFTAEGRCGITGLGSDIRKDGYYMGAASMPKFTEHDEILNHWKPWDETYTTILRPIDKPVALYARTVQSQIPALDQPCGFDLEVGDWVAPYGKGVESDFIFTLHQEVRGLQDYDVTGELSFNNSLDGLQATPLSKLGKNSAFQWERFAPENGYQAKFQLQNSWHKSKGITRSFKFQDGVWDGYFFRVRTVEQDGKIVSARYGKIRGGIEIFPHNLHEPNPIVDFIYYFNPTANDRNLEWDTQKNLFQGLNNDEIPRPNWFP